MCHFIADASPLGLVGFGQLVMALACGTRRQSKAIFELVPISIVPAALD
jgi:hypothetical protein